MADEEPTQDELLKVIEELQQEIDEKDKEIAELTQSRTGRKKGRGALGPLSDRDEINALETENEDLQKKFDASQEKVSGLREELANINAKFTSLSDEKQALDKLLKTQNKRVEDLEKDIAEERQKSRSNELQSREFNKLKTANVKEANRLLSENQALDEENQSLRQELQAAEEDRLLMEEMLAKFADEKEELAAHIDRADLERDSLVQDKERLEGDLTDKLSMLEAASRTEAQYERSIEDLRKELMAVREKSILDAKGSQMEVSELKKQVAVLRDTTKVGEKQRALEALQSDSKENMQLIKELQESLEMVDAEKALLAERLLDLEEGVEQRVADRIAMERGYTKRLQQDVENLRAQNQDTVEHYQQMEQERNLLMAERDELNNWMAVYEAGHGMQEQSRVSKKLKEDNRRLDIAMQAFQSQVGVLTDANAALTQAFARLKKETGKPADFSYPELELHTEVQSANTSLLAQKIVLEEQVATLEAENTRMRTAMKNQAASIGEQGFKYTGMSPDMLLQVNDFASNLRDGKVELPLNDRSRTLLGENNALKDEIGLLRLQVERYEREIAGSISMSPRGVVQAAINAVRLPSDDSRPAVVHDDVLRLAQENVAMHEKLSSLQSDLQKLLQKPTLLEITDKAAAATTSTTPRGVQGMISASELSDILTQNNRLMMKELEAIRTSRDHDHRYFDEASLAVSTAARETPYSISRNKAVTAAVSRAAASYSSRTPAATATAAVTDSVRPTAWTPALVRGGMSFTAAMGPATPHGKQLLKHALNQMNLPPEEWAQDVRDLNSQLIECLEQLYEREQELEDQSKVLSTMEENLAGIKQQMTSLYYDYAQRSELWEKRESQHKKDHKALNEERDDLRLKLRRMQDMAELLQRDNNQGDSIHLKIAELTRKVTIYEVNEAVLSRKYIAQSEQLQQDVTARLSLESDFVEMEASLKRRILYLEQYKLAAGSRIGHLQVKVDASVPQSDYLALQMEIDVLREDHLNTLRREVEARMASLKALDHATELRSARIINSRLQSDLDASQTSIRSKEAELLHQKELTARALNAAKSSLEVSQLVSELARFRGEASRLEVELMASNRRAELLGEKLQDILREAETSERRVKELERREIDLNSKESAARRQALEMQLLFDGGLTRSSAEELRLRLEKQERQLLESAREVARHKEIAEIASQQAQSLSSFKKHYQDELVELREYCVRLESRSDDELVIGRLQRQLMSTKTTYKAFVRKYHFARENMRKRELALRVLENRLDEQDKSVLKAQESFRLEVSALKKALYNLKNSVFENQEFRDKRLLLKGADRERRKTATEKTSSLARSGFSAISLGEKLVDVSSKVDELASQAEDAASRAAQSEAECRQMKDKVDCLSAERAILERTTVDLEALLKGKSKQQAIAARLIALSEDIRVSKIANLQQRRQIQVLREEKRHLHSVISNIEADVMELEESKVESETKHILYDIHDKTGLAEETFASSLLNFSQLKKDHTTTDSADRVIPPPPLQTGAPSSKLTLDMDAITGGEESTAITSDELYRKLKAANDSVAEARREASEVKLKNGSLINQIASLEAHLQEKDGQIKYYEHVLNDEGLPGVMLRNPSNRARAHNSALQQPATRMMRDEQEQLQEAASATIGSLRSLLEEKNRIIDKYREKVERMQQSAAATPHGKSRAERRADDLLERMALDDSEEARAKRSGSATRMDSEDGAARIHRQQLLTQIEQADSIIAEKSKLVNQLEQKLLAESNQRERAEARCGESIQEMEAMKEDMITLVQQLQESQARCAHLAKASSGRTAVIPEAAVAAAVQQVTGAPVENNRTKELEKLVRSKEDKVKGYRDIIIRLKDEFIKAEEEKAAAEVRLKVREVEISNNSSSSTSHGGISVEEMKALKNKLTDLHEGLAHAKDDLDKARKVRERLTLEKRQTEESLNKMQDELQKSELQMISAQNGYHRVRKELEASRKNEVRLRERLKEALGGEGAKDTLVKARDRIEALEREVDVLKAQNAALKGREAMAESAEPVNSGGGHVLGTGSGNIDETRLQMHSKWEQEKRLQKRVGTLEKRLAEKMTENEELQLQLNKSREALQDAVSSKEDLQKKAQSSLRHASETRKLTSEDLGQLEHAHVKIYALEEELVQLRRKAHVEQSNEISALGHQISTQRARISELEADIAECERRLKRSNADDRGGQGPRSALRESEDQYLREERLRDDVDLIRRQKLELEAALLERDARAIESKFDLEASELEIGRLKRRVKELESSYKALSSLSQGSTARANSGSSAMSSRGKREEELEGIVEAMKRVVDKLKADNDRLKRTAHGDLGSDERKTGDFDRKLQSEKKRADRLEEEKSSLMEKLKGHEENSQKIVQRQQQVAMLRRQVKAKEEDMQSTREQLEAVIVERETLKGRMSGLQGRIDELESALLKQQQQQGSTNQKSLGAAPTVKLDQLQRELAASRSDKAALQRENDSLRNQADDLRRLGPSASGAELLSESKRLREENTKLRRELSAFDLDFFEEIENLKYAHAEAIRKLRLYESGGSVGLTADGGRGASLGR